MTILARSCCVPAPAQTAVTGHLPIDLAHFAHVQKIPVTVSQMNRGFITKRLFGCAAAWRSAATATSAPTKPILSRLMHADGVPHDLTQAGPPRPRRTMERRRLRDPSRLTGYAPSSPCALTTITSSN